MRVIPVAQTIILHSELQQTGYELHPFGDDIEWIDELAEAAGRNCYQSWDRPNPETASNEGYLANILSSEHLSVLEHGSVTFFVDGVSRTLLTELERHRHLSFSVLSQRYVDESGAEFIVPPALKDDRVLKVYATRLFQKAVDAYQDIYDVLMESSGLTKKQAREAARSVLPGGTETKMFVTGNIRTWREVVQKRGTPAADAEIQRFAQEILTHLRLICPNSVQDLGD